MYNTLLTVLLASTSLASGQVGGYGAYGSYSAYGWYGSYPGRYPANAYVVPYYLFPFVEISAADSHAAKDKEQDVMEKRFGELKSILGTYEQKIRGLEQKLEEQDKTSETQTKLMEKLTHLQEGKMAEDQMKNLFGRVEDRLKTIEDKLVNGSAQGTGPLEQRIALLEKQLLGAAGLNDTIKTSIDSLGQKLGAFDRNEPKNQTGRFATGIPFNRGLIVVSLPADAKLFLDNLPSAVGANLRSFISPELEVNKNYFYTIRVEVERNGKTLTESQRVYFQPGREVRVSFDHIDNGTANAQNKSD